MKKLIKQLNALYDPSPVRRECAVRAVKQCYPILSRPFLWLRRRNETNVFVLRAMDK